MICTDKLSEGIKRSSCPQDTLRGFTGSIIIQDWRGYNPFNPQSIYQDSVEFEAEKYSIRPETETQVRDDNISLFRHNLSFFIKNNSDTALDNLAGLANIPLIVSLELEDGNYLTLFKETGAKINISAQYFDSKNGFVDVTLQPYHTENSWESRAPIRETLEGIKEWDVTFTVLDDVSNPVEGAEISVDGKTYTTDVNGQAIAKIANGTYSYDIIKSGYNATEGTVTIDNQDVSINETLTETISTVYGYLYNFYSVDSAANISNTGWHVPTPTDYQTLVDYVASQGFSGTESVALRTERQDPDPHPRANSDVTPGTNDFNFSAYPGGSRQETTGDFVNLGVIGSYWRSDSSIAGFSFTNNTVNLGSPVDQRKGFSLRFIKDDDVLENYVGNNGRVYQAVKIGNQVWMAENLAETQYRDGTSIPTVTDATNWSNLTTGAKCAYNNDLGFV